MTPKRSPVKKPTTWKVYRPKLMKKKGITDADIEKGVKEVKRPVKRKKHRHCYEFLGRPTAYDNQCYYSCSCGKRKP